MGGSRYPCPPAAAAEGRSASSIPGDFEPMSSRRSLDQGPATDRTLRRIAIVVTSLLLVSGVAAAGLVAAQPASIEQMRINQLQYIGTHNSYHVRIKPHRNFKLLNYTHPPLDVQLDRGVRSLELDLHNRDGVVEVFHVVKIDEGTTCRRLGDGLETVRKWSDAHPRHLPISFLFELKKDGPGWDPKIRPFDAAALDALDALVRSIFPASRCITPDDVRGNLSTLRE